MAGQDDFFTPEEVDEQLEAIEQTGRASAQDLRLIASLSGMLSEQQVVTVHPDETHERILARVFSRLLSAEENLRATETEQPHTSPSRSMSGNGRYAVLPANHATDGQGTFLFLEQGGEKQHALPPRDDGEPWNGHHPSEPAEGGKQKQASLRLGEGVFRRKGQHPMKHSLKTSAFSKGSIPATKASAVQTGSRRRGMRLLGLLAAVLVCVTLVGSLVLVLNAARSKAPATTVGARNATRTTPPATATRSILATCRNQLDPAEQTLCATGQETTLNLPLTVRDQKITVVRAYADQQRVIFIYSSASSLDQTIIWHHLISQQGLLSNDASLARHINTTLYELTFLPDVSQILTKAVLQVESIQVIGPSVSPKPMTLQFTLPVHTGQRVVPLNQTQTSRGLKLTLQSVTFTSCTTGLSIEINPSLDHFLPAGPLSFTLNGQSFTWHMYQENLMSGTSSGTSTVNGIPGVPNTTNEIILFDQVNALPVGADTIQIQVNAANVVHTWTFQINVPAPASA